MRRSLDDPQERASLLTRLRTLSHDSARQWGRMNAHQAVCHLSDAFRVMMAPAPVPSQSNLLTRTLVRWVALHSGMQWPHGVKTVPSINQEKGGTKPVEFGRDVRQLEELLEQFARRTSANLQPHPIFGPLSSTEWQHWAYLHIDHHLRQFGK